MTTIPARRHPRRARRVLLTGLGCAAVLLLLHAIPVSAGPSTHPTVEAALEGLPAAASVDGPDGGMDLLGGDDGASPSRSRPVEAPMTFDLVAFGHPDVVDVTFRASTDGEDWSEWLTVDALADDDEGPDRGTEGGPDAYEGWTEPAWVGEADHLEVRLPAGSDVEDLDVRFLDSSGHHRNAPQRVLSSLAMALSSWSLPTAEADDAAPDIITREEWGADESLRNGGPTYAEDLSLAVVHHTAGSSDYSEAQAPAIVRGIYHYHTQTLGWNDIGYNMLVDHWGNLYEGRAGGIDQPVAGAHARGFNTGSFGISVLGSYDGDWPPRWEARQAVADAVAWKFALHDIDPLEPVTVVSGGSASIPRGEEVELDPLVGHRDIGQTACPGGAFYAQLPEIRTWVAERTETLDVEQPPPPPDEDTVPEDSTEDPDSELEESTEDPEDAELDDPTTEDPEDDEPEISFSDVADGSTHEGGIYAIAEAGITVGCGDGSVYCPDDAVTRAEMATFLARLGDFEPVEDHGFTDVGDSGHAGAIGAIAEAGITTGCGDGTIYT
ncbi:MAG: N-acetylmuramoyl-L-alanine amidase [Planctomycetota bacterium]